MIVLKEDGLPEVWEEAMGLISLETSNNLSGNWGDRKKDYFWANWIEYEHGAGKKYTEILMESISLECFPSLRYNYYGINILLYFILPLLCYTDA